MFGDATENLWKRYKGLGPSPGLVLWIVRAEKNENEFRQNIFYFDILYMTTFDWNDKFMTS